VRSLRNFTVSEVYRTPTSVVHERWLKVARVKSCACSVHVVNMALLSDG